MQNIWREVAFLVIALLLSGCAVVKNESCDGAVVALGGACTGSINADSAQKSSCNF